MKDELSKKIEMDKIIGSEAMEWFSKEIEKSWSSEMRAYVCDPPTLIDAFFAGWYARESFDIPQANPTKNNETI